MSQRRANSRSQQGGRNTGGSSRSGQWLRHTPDGGTGRAGHARNEGVQYQKIRSALERLMDQPLSVSLRTGEVLEGSLHSVNPTKMELIMATGEGSSAAEKGARQPRVFSFGLVDRIVANGCTLDVKHNSVILPTDGDISRANRTNGHVPERELEVWTGMGYDDGDNGVALSFDDSTGWNAQAMLDTNQKKFNVQSSFNEDLSDYTTPLVVEDNEKGRQQRRDADRIAKEIEQHSYEQHMDAENLTDQQKYGASRNTKEQQPGTRQPPVKTSSSTTNGLGKEFSLDLQEINEQLDLDLAAAAEEEKRKHLEQDEALPAKQPAQPLGKKNNSKNLVNGISSSREVDGEPAAEKVLPACEVSMEVNGDPSPQPEDASAAGNAIPGEPLVNREESAGDDSGDKPVGGLAAKSSLNPNAQAFKPAASQTQKQEAALKRNAQTSGGSLRRHRRDQRNGRQAPLAGSQPQLNPSLAAFAGFPRIPLLNPGQLPMEHPFILAQNAMSAFQSQAQAQASYLAWQQSLAHLQRQQAFAPQTGSPHQLFMRPAGQAGLIPPPLTILPNVHQQW